MANPDAPRLRWQDHIGLIISGSLTAVTVTNVAAVSRWDPAVALALVQTTSATNVILSSLVAITPTILFGATAAVGATVVYARVARDSGWRRSGTAVMLAAALTLVCISSLPILNLALLLIALLTGVVFALWDRGKQRVRRIQSYRVLASYLVTPAVWLILGGSSWYPAENLTFADSAGTKSAFVVSSEGDETVLLTINSRRVEYVRGDVLRKRELCDQQGSILFSTLPDVLGRNRQGLAPCETERR